MPNPPEASHLAAKFADQLHAALQEHAPVLETLARQHPATARLAADLFQMAALQLDRWLQPPATDLPVAGEDEHQAPEAARSTPASRATVELRLADGPPVAVRAIGTASEVEAAARAARPRERIEPAPPAPRVVEPPMQTAWAAAAGRDAATLLTPLPTRLRLKAKAARAIADGRADDTALTGQAGWIGDPSQNDALRGDRTLCQHLAAACDATAAACDLLLYVHQHEATLAHPYEEVKQAMLLTADAQSDLRLIASDAGVVDDDQDGLFHLLRQEAHESQRAIFLPGLSNGERRSIREIEQTAAAARERLGALKKTGARKQAAARSIERLRSAAAQYALLAKPFAAPQAKEAAAEKLVVAIALAVVEGELPVTDTRLREVLKPFVISGELPEVNPAWLDDDAQQQAVTRVIESAEEAVARVEAAQAHESEPTREPSEALRRARALLEGRVMLLVGGEAREHSRLRLERDLGLAELRWETVAHHQRFDSVDRAIARGDVDLVAVMIKLSSHRDGPAARAACERAGIPFVILPAGYGSDRVANDIAEQASDALQRRPRAG